MDELVHHCLREIAFDGDLGCDVSRLRQFIEGFYVNNSQDQQDHNDGQTVDDSLRSFVWSLIVQEQSITVGLVPEGSAPVAIAPQPSAIRKSGNSSSSKAKVLPPVVPASLSPLGAEEAKINLEDLIAKYGSTLRIAVDHDASFAAITGSHIRSAKLSPMVYTALQFITRSREHGLPMTTLGECTGYDQKTVHYLASQLLDLDLINKVRTSGKSKHSCIHKYFYHRSVFHRQANEEEIANKQHQRDEVGEPEGSHPELDSDAPNDEAIMEPLEPRAIGSTSIVRARLIKLLKRCPNYLHQYENLLLALGCHNPSKPERRLFSSRMKELLNEGTIEKVYAPHASKHGTRILCVRLVEGATQDPEIVLAHKDDELNDILLEDNTHDINETRPVANVSMQHQVLRLILESGMEGITMNEITSRMCNLDKRTVEQLLVRYERESLPPHLADLSLVQMIETVKREHRHKFFTVENYHAMVIAEGLPQRPGDKGSQIDTSLSGAWSLVQKNQFYAPGAEGFKYLATYQDNYTSNATSGSVLKIRQPKPGKRVNPLGPDGKPRKGRPRKEWKESNTEGPKVSRKLNTTTVTEDRGSPVSPLVRSVQEFTQGNKRKRRASMDGDDELVKPPKKKRGRPKKSSPVTETQATRDEASRLAAAKPKERKRRNQKSSAAKADKAEMNPECPSDPPNLFVEGPPLSATLQASESSDKNSVVDEDAVALSEPPTSPSFAVPDVSRKRTCTSLPSIEEGARPTKKAHIAVDAGPIRISLATESLVTTPSVGLSQLVASQPRGMAQNVSYMRREKEIIQVLADMGGIAMVGVDMSKKHLEVLERWSAEGRAVSAPPGTFLDRRTLSTLGQTMESKGIIKTIKTAVTSIGGTRRPATLFCLTDVLDEQVASYINNLSAKLNDRSGVKVPTIRTVAEEFKGTATRIPQPLEADSHRNSRSGQQSLIQMTPLEIRSELLRDPRTASQLYGYITGKMMRARELHLFTLYALAQDEPSIYFTSVPDYIIKAEYFWSDVPLGVYCSLVSITHHISELEDFLQTPDGPVTKLRNLPPDMCAHVLPGGTRSRSRILQILECLRTLGIVTPLYPTYQQSTLAETTSSESSNVSFEAVDGPIKSFDEAPIWQFNLIAPVYGFARSAKAPPPILGHLPIATVDESVVYWNAVKEAAKLAEFVIPGQGEAASTYIDAELGRFIKRESAWQKDYSLSSNQVSYLELMTDSANGSIPIPNDTSDPDDPFNVLCFAVAAPVQAVSKFYANWQASISAVIKRKQQKMERGEQFKRRDVAKAQKAARELLAQKSKEAKEKVLDDWKTLVSEVNPAVGDEVQSPSLIRWKKIFVSSAGNVDRERMKSAITSAFAPRRNLEVTKPPISSRPKHAISKAMALDRTPRNKSSIQDLVMAQQSVDKPPRKSKNKSALGKEGTRRARFSWNADFDELAQDATAVIAARCRSLGRMDWGAMDQVFPGTDRNGVRQRILRFREEPGFEAYMLRLERAFYHLWLDHRGTDDLPDSDPQSPVNFDLVAHIMFLRNFVDKVALRAGIAPDTTKTKIPVLPARKADLETFFRITPRLEDAQWDFMWNLTGEEQRERAMLKEPLAANHHISQDHYMVTGTERSAAAESAIKMMLETPDGNYDPDVASSMLKTCGEDNVSKAMETLQSGNVITKVISDPAKRAPGRTWRFQDWQQDSVTGPINPKLYRDAQSFEDILFNEPVQDWSLLANDGDIAALLQLVSDEKVVIKIDTSAPAMARPEVDGNSKKVADDQLETSIMINLRGSSIYHPDTDPISPLSIKSPTKSIGESFLERFRAASNSLNAQHQDGPQTSCALHNDAKMALFDCDACVGVSEELASANLSCDDTLLTKQVLHVIKSAKGDGVTLNTLQPIANSCSHERLHNILALMASQPIPPLFWTGYRSPLIVSSRYLRQWTVMVPGSIPGQMAMIFPRRWLDIYGDVIERVWFNALRQVAGWVWNRPGISLLDLRLRIRQLLDKHEVVEVVEHLRHKGMLEIRFCFSKFGELDEGKSSQGSVRQLASFDDEESRNIFLLLTGDSWYRISA